jgi:hypothetical protein
MSVVVVDLPLPAGNGPGAAVDTSLFAKDKAIVVGGSFPGATITIEVSVDGGVVFAPVATFQSHEGKKKVVVVCDRMRTNVSGRGLVFTANVDVGADDIQTVYAVLPLPAAPGPGAPINVATMGLFKTAVLGGDPGSGAVYVQASEDGVTWAPCTAFQAAGIKRFSVATQFLRTFVIGGSVAVTVSVGAELGDGGDCEDCLTNAPPTQIDVGDAAVVGVAAEGARADHQHALPSPPAPLTVTGPTNLAGVALTVTRSDHRHRLEVMVEDEGVLAGARPIINFIGAGVTAVDDPGNDRVNVVIPGGGGGGEPCVLSFGVGNVGAAAGTRYLDPWYGSNTGVAGTMIAEKVAPRAGMLQSLFALHNRAVGNGNLVTYAILINGVVTLLTVTLATGAAGQASDLVNMVAVAQGDTIALRAVKALAIGNGQLEVLVTMELV